MIACTKFSLIPEAVSPKAIAFDTLDRLVAGIIAFSTLSEDRQIKAAK